jgi:hypothetical protein
VNAGGWRNLALRVSERDERNQRLRNCFNGGRISGPPSSASLRAEVFVYAFAIPLPSIDQAHMDATATS